jgi:transcriptional regulator with XRE-family HTH domain
MTGASRTTGTRVSREAGNRLREEREARHWSPDELSALVAIITGPDGPRVDAKLVRLMEQGVTERGQRRTRIMSVDEAVLLAQVLGIPVGELLGQQENGRENGTHHHRRREQAVRS